MKPGDLLYPTEHHLVPKTHRDGPRNNVIEIPEIVHRAWHQLFQVLRPENVVMRIVVEWLPPDQVGEVIVTRGEHVVLRCRPMQVQPRRTSAELDAFNLVFPTNRPHEILKWWAWRWVPTDYFSLVEADVVGRPYLIYPDQPDPPTLERLIATEQRLLRRFSSNGHQARK